MSERRYLDPSEAYHAFVDWSGSYSVTCDGAIDSGLLIQSFEALCDSRPLLRGYLGRDERGFFFDTAGKQAVETVVREGGEAEYLDEMRRPLDSSRSLCRFVLVRGDERSHLVLVVHHSMTDGRGGITLLERLLRHYTALVRGEIPETAAVDALPASAEHLLRERGAASAAEPAVDRAALRQVLATTPSPEHLVVVPDRIRLDEDATAELVGGLRAQGLSVHAFVAGVATVALREELGGDGGARSMVCGCPVDLRHRVRPAVTVDESTVFVSGIETEVEVPEDADPRAVGLAIKARLDAAIAGGEAERAILEAGQFAASEPRTVDLVVSNFGSIPSFVTPEGLRVTDFRGFTTTTMPGLRLFVLSSCDGRLSVEIISPGGSLTAEQRSELMRRTEEILKTAVTVAP
ncbi:hypothetical protein ABT112_14890 [Streptomyces sp. NPDC002055]|uniref:phthiocerol/phthiodiolone dimycocerosyl transferase family protein n=1 Tax=Streptomyces sp. NPDC002055 TaxID=3154534 RepID=UPI0033289BF8